MGLMGGSATAVVGLGFRLSECGIWKYAHAQTLSDDPRWDDWLTKI